MRWGVVTFPGSLDDSDAVAAIEGVLGDPVTRLWHKEQSLHGVDCVVLPGGFSYGDYLRPGAMARFSPIMERVIEFASAGGLVLGICNGFQILCEAGLLPGALVSNCSMSFICDIVTVRVEENDTAFTRAYTNGEVLKMPIKHGAGCFVAAPAMLEELEDRRQVIFRYVDSAGRATADANPNGSLNNIAGICNQRRNVVGLMPHPEHACEKLVGSDSGLGLFRSIKTAVTDAAGRQRESVPSGL